MIEAAILHLEGCAAIVTVLLWTLTFCWAAYSTSKLFDAVRLIEKLKKELKAQRSKGRGGKHLADE